MTGVRSTGEIDCYGSAVFNNLPAPLPAQAVTTGGTEAASGASRHPAIIENYEREKPPISKGAPYVLHVRVCSYKWGMKWQLPRGTGR